MGWVEMGVSNDKEGGEVLIGEAFERHARQMVHFYTTRVPPRLRALLSTQAPGCHLMDVGCGDGQLIWAVMNAGLLPPGGRITGVDISPVRVERFTRLTGWPGIQTDGAGLYGVPDGAADVVVSTMVMEHVPDDAAYARALARVTRPGGTVFLTTVLRKPGAWYFRKAPDGRRVLDPTHVREYGNVNQVRELLETAGLEVVDTGLERIVFPVLVPAARWWHAHRPIPDVQRLFLRQPWSSLERIGLPIPRYREIQFVLRRQTSAGEAAR